MTKVAERFAPFAEKMKAAGLPELFIRKFAHYYRQLVEGGTGIIREDDIEPVTELPDMDELPSRYADIGASALQQTVLIKLNGGLGTSMGLLRPKSLLEVKEGLSFLDIIVRQVQEIGVPLVLMNSFVTDEETMSALEKYPELQGELPLRFLQHKEPKIRQDDLRPVSYPEDPELEWCPPGHGDIYSALVTSKTLGALLDAGHRYAFVSNVDNLGAVMDRTLLGYFVSGEYPFMMEVADRTRMDRKGGHLAQRADGQLILRESAQTVEEDMDAFQDISRHQYFNTNNLWLDLEALQRVMESRDYLLGLPMIRNRKTVDPRDEESTPVYQLETAMGSAIGVFEGSHAVRVPRSRFAPVKKTDDLLTVRSDVYELTDNFHVVPNPARPEHLRGIEVELDEDCYKFVTELDARFPHGAPSLLQCELLKIEGDFRFGRDVTCRGAVELRNERNEPVQIPDGAVLEG